MDSLLPSHLEKEMMQEMAKMRKQLTAIQKILEVVNEEHADDSNVNNSGM